MKFAFRHNEVGIIQFDALHLDEARSILDDIVQKHSPQTSINDWYECELDAAEGEVSEFECELSNVFHFQHDDAGVVSLLANDSEGAMFALLHIIKQDFPTTELEEWKQFDSWWFDILAHTPQG